MTSDPNEIAEHFNEYFINLAGPNLAVKRLTSLRNFDSYLGESYLNSIFLKAITIIAELSRAKRASGAPWVRKFGKLSIR